MKNLWLVLVLPLLLQGCGWVSFGNDASKTKVETLKIMSAVSVNKESIEYVEKTIKAHLGDYNEEQLKRLTQAQGALLSILRYAQKLSTTGEANIGNANVIWDMAQIEYWELIRIIDTSTWTEPDRLIFENVNREAKRLSFLTETALVIAGEEADRATVDAILEQIMTVSSLIMPML